jgi:hypothetical protein
LIYKFNKLDESSTNSSIFILWNVKAFSTVVAISEKSAYLS